MRARPPGPTGWITTPASRVAIAASILSITGCEFLTDAPEPGSRFDRSAVASGAVYALDVSYWTGYLEPDDVACWRDEGFHHLIVGVHVEDTTRQQLRTAVDAGMTVEAYVPLYWDGDMTYTVDWAMGIIVDYPVDRLWLDAEKASGGRSAETLTGNIQEAVDACGDFPCGIYTRKGWWEINVQNTDMFSHLPLWYAAYDGRPGFDDWEAPDGPFGGWAEPTGKQYDSNDTGPPLCGVEVDYDVIIPPGEGGVRPDPPPTPTLVAPPDGESLTDAPVELSVQPISRVTHYEFRIQFLNDGTWHDYHQYFTDKPSQRFWPQFDDTRYRWDARARNIGGWSQYSKSFEFYFGDDGGGDGDGGGGDDGGGGGGGGDVPPKPTGLDPNDEPIPSGSVTLTCSDPTGAAEYEFEIEFENAAGDWQYYYTYSSSTCEQTFWPQNDDTNYQWRVRARNANGWGQWSDPATFVYGDSGGGDEGGGGGGGGGGDVPPKPTGLDPNDEPIPSGSVTLTCSDPTGAAEYEFEIEFENAAGDWQYYYTYSSSTCEQTFWPQNDDTEYRWRVRARNANGWGPWSNRATFGYGDSGGGGGGGGGGGDVPPKPSGLDPSGGETVTSSSVNLTVGDPSSALEFEFEIEFEIAAGDWRYYYTYSSGTNSKTFWPAYEGTRYRWRARARNSAGWGEWSGLAYFSFEPG